MEPTALRPGSLPIRVCDNWWTRIEKKEGLLGNWVGRKGMGVNEGFGGRREKLGMVGKCGG